MTEGGTTAPRGLGVLVAHWPLFVGLAALVIPTIAVLARDNWTTEAGVQGPIILATGFWLF